MKNILIAGGSGLIGSELEKLLLEKGYIVSILSRNPRKENQYFWNPATGDINETCLADIEVLINVSGADIAGKRWTESRKKELYQSRIGSNQFLYSLIGKMPNLQQFISSSGVNCYGYDQHERIHKEEDPFGDDYVSQLVKQWEESADLFKSHCKVAKIRTAVVLSPNGGALQRMKNPVKFGIGSALGNGKQDMPWIHVDDLAQIFIHCMEEKLEGTYNAAAGFVSNEEFMRTLASVMSKPFWFPNVPAFTLKLLFGEMASLILCGIKVSNDKIKETGFQFKFSELKLALQNTLE